VFGASGADAGAVAVAVAGAGADAVTAADSVPAYSGAAAVIAATVRER